MNNLNNLTSPQAMAVFEVLKESQELTAKEIGKELGIFPNTVYRAMKQLLGLGVVVKINSYPSTYSVAASASAMETFILSAQTTFQEKFLSEDVAGVSQNAAMSFIKSRSSLLQKTDKDTSKAKSSINFIVSGLQVPDDSILTYHRAIARKVHIRALLQKRDDTTPGKLEKWREIGVEVRYIDDYGIRMFCFDTEVVYLTSYNQKIKEEAQGVRLVYKPLAIFMNSIFEQKWAAATE